MQLNIHYENKTLYIALRGEMDEHTASKCRRDADKLAHTYLACDRVVFDLREVSFMDSTGIGFLIGRYKTFQRIGTPCFLMNVSNATDKILSISGVYALMPKLQSCGGNHYA